jgi:hypothetical protein
LHEASADPPVVAGQSMIYGPRPPKFAFRHLSNRYEALKHDPSMKWYLSLIGMLFLGVLGYQLFALVRWTPSMATLGQTISVSAPAQLGVQRPQGRVHFGRSLSLQGNVIFCGIGSEDCEWRFPNLRDGESLDAKLVHLPNGRGGLWLAMAIRRANGDSFSNSPQHIVDAWKRLARTNMSMTAIAIFLFLIVLPACVSERFRQAWAMIGPDRNQESEALVQGVD